MATGRGLLRLRMRWALLISAPAVLLCAWYAWDAYARLDRYRRTAAPDRSLSRADFHIGLYDSLRRDLRRLSLPARPVRERLPRYRFRLEGLEYDRLLAGAELTHARPYTKARLRRGRRTDPVRLRLKGQRHWHLQGAKKSLKVRFSKKGSRDGLKALGLIAEPTPMVVGESLVAELAAEQGLLTADEGFARVWINGLDQGVYRRQIQADEGLLRMRDRFPCSMFSGNLPHGASDRDLWRDPGAWKKVAWCSGEKGDRTELERLLEFIGKSTQAQFVDFARNELDQTRFATLEALEIAFGIDQRDWRQGHKLVFDPYRGRWEPVAWSLRGFKHRPEFELAEHPLDLRLKYVPGYLTERNRILYDLLVGPARPAEVRRRGLALLTRLVPELASDPHFCAYKLLPDVDPFLYRMVRPMDVGRLGLAFEAAMATYAERQRFLVAALERNPLQVRMGSADSSGRIALELVMTGRSGVALTALEARMPAGCDPSLALLKDGASVPGRFEAGHFELDEPLALQPRIQLVSRSGGDDSLGAVRARPAPVVYRLSLAAACAPDQLNLLGRNLSTGTGLRVRAESGGPAPARLRALLPSQVPGLHSGEVPAHPWDLAASAGPVRAPSRELGPGEVRLDGLSVFPAGQRVRIAPGTRLALGPGASLIFLGRVIFDGRAQAPIVVEPAGPAAFGGLALVGPATAGSRLHNVVIKGGSRPHWRAARLPGTLNLHDSRDIELEDCSLSNNQGADDMLHAAYVEDLRLARLQIRSAAADGVDLEFCRARMTDAHITGSGDEAIDLMGTELDLIDAVLIGAGGSALSAGQRSRVRVRGSLLSVARTGVTVKASSRVALSGSLVYASERGLRIESAGRYYPRASELQAGFIAVVDCVKPTKLGGRGRFEVDRLVENLPPGEDLAHLRRDVLALPDWTGLAGLVEAATR